MTFERDRDAAALRGRLGAPDGAPVGDGAPAGDTAPDDALGIEERHHMPASDTEGRGAARDGAPLTLPTASAGDGAPRGPAGAATPSDTAALNGAAPQPQARLVACDLDGVLYRGAMVLPGAVEAVKDAVARGLTVRYVSNNSTAHRRVVAQRLAGMGFPADEEMVITSAYVTGRWLRARLAPGAPIMVVGEEGLVEELTEAGFSVYRAGESPAEAPLPDGTAPGAPVGASTEGAEAAPLAAPIDAASAVAPSAAQTDAASTDEAPGAAAPATPAAVVVGMDRSFTFAKLAAAQKAIMDGALFVATNRDATFPTPDGLMPGAGAVVAAVEVAAQKEPVLIGKPSPISAEVLAEATGVAAGETVFIGDRVSTDIVMGCEAGMKTVLVLTGVTCAEGPQNALADFVLSDLSGLGGVLEGLGCGDRLEPDGQTGEGSSYESGGESGGDT